MNPTGLYSIPFYSDGSNQEKVNYDRIQFPLYISDGDLAKFPKMSALCHWHEDMEFLVVLDGYLRYHVNGVPMTLQQGEGVFVNSRQLHYGCTEDGSNSSFLCILIQPALLHINSYIGKRFLTPLLENPQFPAAHLKPDIPWQGAIMELLRNAYQIYQEKADGFELEISRCYFGILTLLYRNMPHAVPDHTAASLDLLRIHSMVRFLEEQSAEQIALRQIAQAGDVSVSTCCTLFRRYLGRAPIEYLTALRLDRSCGLLRETKLTITEIAFRVGFSGSSYYAERFLQQYGCTPRAYRKKTENSG